MLPSDNSVFAIINFDFKDEACNRAKKGLPENEDFMKTVSDILHRGTIAVKRIIGSRIPSGFEYEGAPEKLPVVHEPILAEIHSKGQIKPYATIQFPVSVDDIAEAELSQFLEKPMKELTDELNRELQPDFVKTLQEFTVSFRIDTTFTG
jgi:hypothetical protein